MTDKTPDKTSRPKEFELQAITCPHCNHSFQRYTNYWGTICPGCQQRVPPTVEHRRCKHIRLKREKLIRQVILSILEKEGGDT